MLTASSQLTWNNNAVPVTGTDFVFVRLCYLFACAAHVSSIHHAELGRMNQTADLQSPVISDPDSTSLENKVISGFVRIRQPERRTLYSSSINIRRKEEKICFYVYFDNIKDQNMIVYMIEYDCFKHAKHTNTICKMMKVG